MRFIFRPDETTTKWNKPQIDVSIDVSFFSSYNGNDESLPLGIICPRHEKTAEPQIEDPKEEGLVIDAIYTWPL